MGSINVGVASIEVGAVGADGAAGTTLAVLGYTEEGSAKINWDDATETEFPVEEVDLPIFISTKEGKKSITFKIANPDEDTFVSVFGGTKTGVGEDVVYSFPSDVVTIEKTIKFTPKKGIGLLIPRAKISAKLSPDLGRGSLMGVEITGTILQPTKAATAYLSTFRVKTAIG